jgi:hypothetical protein
MLAKKIFQDKTRRRRGKPAGPRPGVGETVGMSRPKNKAGSRACDNRNKDFSIVGTSGIEPSFWLARLNGAVNFKKIKIKRLS